MTTTVGHVTEATTSMMKPDDKASISLMGPMLAFVILLLFVVTFMVYLVSLHKQNDNKASLKRRMTLHKEELKKENHKNKSDIFNYYPNQYSDNLTLGTYPNSRMDYTNPYDYGGSKTNLDTTERSVVLTTKSGKSAAGVAGVAGVESGGLANAAGAIQPSKSAPQRHIQAPVQPAAVEYKGINEYPQYFTENDWKRSKGLIQ